MKGIPNVLSPELLKVIMEMGHADDLVIADGNFPAASTAARLVRADGLGAVALLDAILTLFPLDTFVKSPAALMLVVPGDDYRPDIWKEFRRVVRRREPRFPGFEMMERFDFYERARSAYAVVATGERARYANIILKKGLV